MAKGARLMPRLRLTPEQQAAIDAAPKPPTLETLGLAVAATRKPRRKGQTPEGAVLSACLDYLALKGVLAWRNNTGAVQIEGRHIRYGKVGSSDIIGCLNDGRMLCVECKAKGKKPTEEQRRFLAAVTEKGGLALVVDDVATLVDALEGI